MSNSRLLDPPPHLLRRERHLEISHPERRKRIERGADQRSRRTDAAGFAAALGAERIVRAGLALVALRDEVGQVVGAGDRIVHERSRDELAAAVIGAALEQRLADT